ncbi:MAG: hypothetical protein JO053_10195 [Acidobacteria bacterium]|nr:hypothetical protein [Acidobacteriota bacterium]
MIYHVLPGDAQVSEFQKTKIDGEIIVCREALIDGPIDADSIDEFWHQRASFILSEHGDDEIEYHEKVADPLNKLTELTGEDEVNLWFEYELFCSVNMWFCLSLLEGTGAAVYRVEPIGLDEEDRWNGFGKFTAEEMLAAYELRTKLSDDDIKLGADLWRAYSKGDLAELTTLGKTESLAFPYLSEVTAAAAEQDIRPLEAVREIIAGGETDFAEIFAEFKKRAGVYGYGDTQVQKLIDQLSS